MAFDSLNAQISFTVTATSGLHTVVVEFLPSLYSGAQSITINGASVPISNYTITTDSALSPTVAVLTINNVHFNTDTIIINFQAAATGGGGSSSTSGGGSSTPPIENPPVGSSLSLQIDPITLNLRPGDKPVQNTIKISWQGSTKIIITSIKFATHPE
jgi:hypothetical protein